MDSCWDLKGCPASYYTECSAYKKKVSCWEIKEGCLCRSYQDCHECPIFIKHQEQLREEAEPS